ncbi:MAG: hypothetical protein E6767_04250 [Dysgonomonas sp.]|nr:hypothetical protein [Dysgonomonas sp.]
MKKVFVTYGNERYYSSLERLRKEAEALQFFDEIRIITDKDLPEYITQSALYNYNRGGGYWVWKPWVVLNVLKGLQDDDILIYSDAGCQLFPDREWDEWWKTMKTYNGIFFSYGGTMEQFCRSNLLRYFGNDLLKYYYQIQSGFFIIKKKAVYIAEEWQEIMLKHPEMVMDTTEEEHKNESFKYREHRHDQAVLSGVVYRNECKLNLKVKWQRMESKFRRGQAVYAARIATGRQRPMPRFEPLFITIGKALVFSPYRKIRMRFLKSINNTW